MTPLILALLAAAAAPPPQRLDAAVYDRASRRLPDQRATLVLNATVAPHWRSGPREGFTYRKELGEGRATFVLVDAATGARRPAFDAATVAAGLRAGGLKIDDPQRLPFADYEEPRPGVIAFEAEGRAWTCATVRPDCHAATPAATDPVAVRSPDGRWAAFVKDDNLWVRPAGGGAAFALTHDGAPNDAYGVEADANFNTRERRMRGLPVPPVVLWSPDSRRLFVERIDEREVREVTTVLSDPPGGGTPRAFSWRSPWPGDPIVPMARGYIFDVGSHAGVTVAVPPNPTLMSPLAQARRAWWSPDSSTLYALTSARYGKSMSLYAVQADTGGARRIVGEAGKTFVEPAAIGQRPMVHVLRNGDVLWFSERDGWGRLYLLDGRTGAVKRALTRGPWAVRSLVRVDEARGLVFVEGAGREPGSDPYHRRLYSIALADGRLRLLTPEEADHDVAAPQKAIYEPPAPAGGDPQAHWGFAPSGRFFLDTYTRTDLPPRTVLRRADGTLVAEVERADVSRVLAGGLTPPERFTAPAADGVTPLYGVILRPADFDPNRRYPVIDDIYPGPQITRVRPAFLDTVFDAHGQALAELGFIVVAVDGRGTPGRSKTFHDLSYGPDFQTGNVADHVAVLKTLAARYPQIDLDRVGVYGSSSGGYAALHALLTRPDLYKVGVADAGPHDSVTGLPAYVEVYGGPRTTAEYRAAENLALAPALKGRLLLAHGGNDYVVMPDQTLRMAQALIAADKDFELVIDPAAGHAPLSGRSYATRRAWDFLVRNLQGVEPPAGYDLSRPPPPVAAPAPRAAP